MTHIYILQLVDNKYYIGRTANPNIRLEQHFKSNGSRWTKKYKPIKVIDLISNADIFDEDKYTLKYMNLYGIDNVRGGSFSSIKLSNQNIKIIEKMLNNANDKCFLCHESGHFAKNCKKIKQKIKQKNNIESDSESDSEYNNIKQDLEYESDSELDFEQTKIKQEYNSNKNEQELKPLNNIKSKHNNKSIINLLLCCCLSDSEFEYEPL